MGYGLNNENKGALKVTTESSTEGSIEGHNSTLIATENSSDEAELKAVEEIIYQRTNKDIALIQKGEQGVLAKTESNRMGGYKDVWDRTNRRIEMKEWDDFVQNNPERAARLAHHAPVAEAVKRAEDRKIAALKEELKEKDPENIYTDSAFIDLLNKKVWEGVSRDTSLTAAQYINKSEQIKGTVLKEFIALYPDIAKEYVLDFDMKEGSESVTPVHIKHGIDDLNFNSADESSKPKETLSQETKVPHINTPTSVNVRLPKKKWWQGIWNFFSDN